MAYCIGECANEAEVSELFFFSLFLFQGSFAVLFNFFYFHFLALLIFSANYQQFMLSGTTQPADAINLIL
jgi:hypothetical protein